MGALDSLPPDQRAVLQMVLARGRSYDEIAGLLSIERAAVRQRAIDACAALAPAPGLEPALVTDYLLGQLPRRAAAQASAQLRASVSDRAWAQAVAAQLAPLASRPLPEIPVGAPLGADAGRAGDQARHSDPPVLELPGIPGPEQPPERSAARPSSRRGGAILLGGGAVVLVATIVAVLVTSGGHPHKRRAAGTTTGARSQPTQTTNATTTTGAAQILAQLNLTSPTGVRTTIGVAQVIREDAVVGVVIDAQGVPKNTQHNAYAVWLYNSASSHEFVGFVPKLVGRNEKLATEGRLPADASRYHRLLITLETQSKPTSPGKVVLSGPFREGT